MVLKILELLLLHLAQRTEKDPVRAEDPVEKRWAQMSLQFSSYMSRVADSAKQNKLKPLRG